MDDSGFEVARVKTGGTHWDFYFTEITGSGRVRIGQGCNYNPLGLIQEMFYHISAVGLDNVPEPRPEPRISDIEFNMNDTRMPDEFRSEWE